MTPTGGHAAPSAIRNKSDRGGRADHFDQSWMMAFGATGMGHSLGWALVFGLVSCGGATAGDSAEPSGSESPVVGEPSHTSEPGAAAPVLGEGGLEATWQELGVAGVSNRPDLASTPAGWLALSRREVGPDPRAASAWESHLYRSSDGIRWQRVEVSDRNENLWLWSVAYGAGRYVMAGSRIPDPGGSIFTSDDGEQWLESSIGIPDGERLTGVVYTGDRFFAFGRTRGTVFPYVGDGWQPLDLRTRVFPYDLTFGGGRYLIVGSGEPQFSVDGVSWQSAPLECSLPGGCVETPSGDVVAGHQTRAVYAAGRYFIDQATSTGDAAWEALPGLYPEAEVDGYVLGRSDEDALVAWAPEEPARPLRSVRYVDTLSDAERLERMRWNGSIEPREVTFENFPNGAAVPESLEFPLPNGADCNTARCVLVGDRLFLVATSP
jgi:hypothetical protein